MYPGTDTKSLQLSKQDDNMVPEKWGGGRGRRLSSQMKAQVMKFEEGVYQNATAA